jgi:L-amino acid N-acyltransferase YncA
MAAWRRRIEAILDVWQDGIATAIGRIRIESMDCSLQEFFLQNILAAKLPFGFWVACAEAGAVVGWQSLLSIDNNPVARTDLAESSTYVARRLAGTGIGEALIRHAMQSASETSLHYVFGFISTKNCKAVSLVEKCGWMRAADRVGRQVDAAFLILESGNDLRVRVTSGACSFRSAC